MQQNLEDNNTSQTTVSPGYRLQYLELFNWGTFDGQIYTVRPSGRSSLLTGANGSGKTTLIDSMLTLLVPERKHRFYNQSSGAEKKTERSEESYVLGHYGNIQEEGRSYSTAQQLRGDKRHAYSILLASFKNHENQSITLAQCRWFSGQDLRRSWMVAYAPLTIADDLTPFDPKGQWKRELRKKYPARDTRDTIEFFDSASKYARRMVRIFGMRSHKALTLFNQTVGIKVLGNLDAFIRTNMLEAGSTEDVFLNLKDTYRLLLSAKNAMDKAEKQLEMLTPVKNLAETLSILESSRHDWLRDKQLADLYFAQRKQEALKQHISQTEAEIQAIRETIETYFTRLETVREDKESLLRAMNQDQTGQELAKLAQENKKLEALQAERKEKLTRYNMLASILDFQQNPNEALFKTSLRKCQERFSEIQLKRQQLAQKDFQSKRDLEDQTRQIRIKQNEINQLSQQKNNITGRVAEVREDIAAHIGVSASELPFVAELLQVKPEASDWEAAIEKLLRPFAMRLIVPEQYYSQVNQYVNRVNLGTKLVYSKVPEYYQSRSKVFAPPKALVQKLMFHPNSPYTEWVKDQILTQYDFLCADNLGEFETYRKAITREGLTKSGSRHEKDDSNRYSGRSNFLLGWSNTGKVDSIISEIHALQDKITDLMKEQDHLQEEQKKQDWLLQNIAKFEEIKEFDSLHWEQPADRLETLEQQRINLEHSSGSLQDLNQQVKALADQVDALELERIQCLKQEQELITAVKDYRHQLEEAENLLKHARLDGEDLSPETLQQLYAEFETRFAQQLAGFSLENLSLMSRGLQEDIERRISEFRQRIEQTRRHLERAMLTFKRPDQETLERFPDWPSETYRLPEDIQYVDEYLELFQRLAQDDLPAYTHEFERYLTTHMIQKMADFRESFYQREEVILQTIKDLNHSLNKIDFRSLPKTYIQLKSVRTTSPTIMRFKQMLNEWVPESGEQEGVYELETLKQSFEAIRELIEKLEREENWKKQVTDVRNWNEYYAEEFFRDGDKPMKVYRSMGELSGGEKAQLTYTILGSAIAYQFGISKEDPSHSFRFIAVDESFSNQDDEKATYLMDLCKQLQLQLLVVTPNDKTHIVEPYISSVHFVYRRNNRTSHLLDMPIIEFQHRRQEWQVLEEALVKH